MASFSRLAGVLLLAAPLIGASDPVVSSDPTAPATVARNCLLTPPTGPFEPAMMQAPPPPTGQVLPSNPGAWSTLITPGPQNRWDSKGGLVESFDGSLLLHGVVSGPEREESRLHVVVMVDYAPATSTVISGWNAERSKRLSRVTGSRARVDAQGAAVAFDIELPPQTVPDGTYREIQTLVWLEGGSVDARRWTVYAGPKPPVAAVDCIAADSELPEMPGRTSLGSDGRIAIRAPRATTLAVVPLLASGPGPVQFLRIDQAKQAWEGQLGEGIELAAVWEDPFAGPGKSWISSFWSARPLMQAARSDERQ